MNDKLKIGISQKKSKYDIKKGFKKFGMDAVIVILSGLVVVWQDDPKYMVMIPLVKMGLNYLKHRS